MKKWEELNEQQKHEVDARTRREIVISTLIGVQYGALIAFSILLINFAQFAFELNEVACSIAILAVVFFLFRISRSHLKERRDILIQDIESITN